MICTGLQARMQHLQHLKSCACSRRVFLICFVQSCAVDPGAVSSNIYANSRLPSPIRWFIHNMHAPTRDGASAVLHAATTDWPLVAVSPAQPYKPQPHELRVSLDCLGLMHTKPRNSVADMHMWSPFLHGLQSLQFTLNVHACADALKHRPANSLHGKASIFPEPALRAAHRHVSGMDADGMLPCSVMLSESSSSSTSMSSSRISGSPERS